MLKRWEILTTNTPLLGVSGRAPDGAENVMIFRTGDHWTMIYSEGLANQHLAWATSTILRDWGQAGPIQLPRQSWMARKYGAPFVWREPDQWVMILMGENAARRTTFGLLPRLMADIGSHCPKGPRRKHHKEAPRLSSAVPCRGVHPILRPVIPKGRCSWQIAD